MEKEQTKHRLIIAAVIILFILISVVSFWNLSRTASLEENIESMLTERVTSEERGLEEESKIEVEIAEARYKSLRNYLSFEGIAEPARTMYVIPKIDGRVEDIYVEEGERVEAGDEILALETDEIDQKMKQAQAGLEAAQSQLDMAQEGAREEEINQLQEQIKQVESQVELAQDTYQRTKRLYEEGIVSGQEYDEVKTKKEEARTGLAQVEEKLKMAQQGARQEEITAAKAKVKQAQSELELAELSFDDMVVEAQNEGIIHRIEAEVGQLISSDDPAAIKLDMDTIIASFEVGERDRVRLEQGQKVEVFVDAYEGKEFAGEVSMVSEAADPDTRMFDIEVEIENESQEIKPGMYTRLEVVTEQLDNSLAIPKEAVKNLDNESGEVYVVEDNQIVEKEVTIEDSFSDLVEVSAGLNPGEQVVVDDRADLTIGDEVVPIRGDY